MNKLTVGLVTSPLTSDHAQRGVGFYTKLLLRSLERLASTDKSFEVRGIGTLPTGTSDLSLIHYPFFDFFFPTLKPVERVPLIVTIHDAIPLRFSAHYPPGIRGRLNFLRQKHALSGVASVITDSQVSKNDLHTYLGISQEKIHVVPLAPQFSFPIKVTKLEQENVRRLYNLPEKFALYVGDVDWSKNLMSLALATKKAGLPLVIVGKRAVSPLPPDAGKYPQLYPFRDFLTKFGNDPAILRIGYVPEEYLPVVYSLASVYCQPSFWEGFGLNPLEALAAGCPVVASDTPTLKEVLGDGPIYVEPTVDELAHGMREALEPRTSKQLVVRGSRRAKEFSWDKTARLTLEVYRGVVYR